MKKQSVTRIDELQLQMDGSKANMWHYYATEITGIQWAYREIPHPINVIAAIWNNHAQFVPAGHNRPVRLVLKPAEAILL